MPKVDPDLSAIDPFAGLEVPKKVAPSAPVEKSRVGGLRKASQPAQPNEQNAATEAFQKNLEKKLLVTFTNGFINEPQGRSQNSGGSVVPKPVADLEAGSARISKLATSISQKLSAFEDWLNLLPGKVETTLWVDDPSVPNGDYQYGIRFHRVGKRWVLELTNCHVADSDPLYKLVTDCSVEEKLLVVELAPQLLDKVSSAQAQLEKRLLTAHIEFDSFAKSIGLSLAGEGQ